MAQQLPDWLDQRFHREFPAFAHAALECGDRRRFLQLAAASLALLGLEGCGSEEGPRVRAPYVEQPPGIVAGKARYYATATSLQGYGCGVLLAHRMGRPIKVEGNPDHPASLGATSAIGQASILGLYDPFRAQTTTRAGQITNWEALATAVLERNGQHRRRGGAGLALLTGSITSPTLAAQIAALQHQFPGLRRYQWEAVNRDAVRAGVLQSFGRPLELLPDFAAADVVLAVESDCLESAPGHLRFARDFASRRQAARLPARMSRIYALESTPTLAGSRADHRLSLSPVQLEAALRWLAATLGAAPAQWAAAASPHARLLAAIAQDLRGAQGRALVHVGAAQNRTVQALAHLINHQIGAFGKTLTAIEPVEVEPTDQGGSIAALADAISRAQIDSLWILGASNPAFTAPAELQFAGLLRRVPFSLYLGEYADETAAAVQWHVPQAHEYEAWSDVRAFDGTASIQQPQLLLNSQRRSAHELLALLSGQSTPEGQAIVREQWRLHAAAHGAGDFDSFWNEALRSGVVPGTAAAVLDAPLRPQLRQSLEAPSTVATAAGAAAATALTLLFRPDPFVWDGRFAENGWLQELGRPFTRLTWGNAALIAPATAARLGLDSGAVVEITLHGAKLSAPVLVLTDQAPDCITLPLGFGRSIGGPVSAGAGFDAFALRTAAQPWEAAGALLSKTPQRHAFALIQPQTHNPGSDLIREGTLAQFLQNARFLSTSKASESLYPPRSYPGIAWGMSINLDACIGCQACVAACQAENNSPVVGAGQVMRGREMHWLRVDRYYTGSPANTRAVFQPVPCMQCENAPCEVVCPVHATVHDSEGLNLMVYNRCVGTRFCSNNCPYKVRRFNFFDYTGADPRPPESWNPEVTVRNRGVMEKCTFCVQRTRAAMIAADKEDRGIRDGEVLTACQQACPTRAITFGDRNDPHSELARRKRSPLDYLMLESLNTRPRTSYEALIRNTHPELDDG